MRRSPRIRLRYCFGFFCSSWGGNGNVIFDVHLFSRGWGAWVFQWAWGLRLGFCWWFIWSLFGLCDVCFSETCLFIGLLDLSCLHTYRPCLFWIYDLCLDLDHHDVLAFCHHDPYVDHFDDVIFYDLWI